MHTVETRYVAISRERTFPDAVPVLELVTSGSLLKALSLSNKIPDPMDRITSLPTSVPEDASRAKLVRWSHSQSVCVELVDTTLQPRFAQPSFSGSQNAHTTSEMEAVVFCKWLKVIVTGSVNLASPFDVEAPSTETVMTRELRTRFSASKVSMPVSCWSASAKSWWRFLNKKKTTRVKGRRSSFGEAGLNCLKAELGRWITSDQSSKRGPCSDFCKNKCDHYIMKYLDVDLIDF